MDEVLRSGPGVAGNREGDIHCDRFLPNQPGIGADLLRYVSFCHRQGQIGAQQIAGPEAGLGIDAKGSGLGSRGKSPGTKDLILRGEESCALLSALPIPAGVAWAVLAGMDQQMLRDCVHSFNSSGPDGLLNRHARGTNPRLLAEQKTKPSTEKPFQSLERSRLRRLFPSGRDKPASGREGRTPDGCFGLGGRSGRT